MSLLRYYGAKWELADWIIGQFPPYDYYDCFVDGFGGSGAITLSKPYITPVEVYNDWDGVVHNFMTTIRENGDELIEAIMLTPYSRFELEACRLPTKPDEVKAIIAQLGRVEVARRFYVLSWQGRGNNSATARIRAGWRFVRNVNSSYPPDDFYNVDDIMIAARRLQNVMLENDDCNNVIKRFDTERTLHYLDPPYVHSGERTVTEGYAIEMNFLQHRNLIDTANKLKGMVIVSGYDTQLYKDIMREKDGWRKITKKAKDDRGNMKTEALWLRNIPELQQSWFNNIGDTVGV